jgi:hypothetical protein
MPDGPSPDGFEMLGACPFWRFTFSGPLAAAPSDSLPLGAGFCRRQAEEVEPAERPVPSSAAFLAQSLAPVAATIAASRLISSSVHGLTSAWATLTVLDCWSACKSVAFGSVICLK